jgi:hypothetical protein
MLPSNIPIPLPGGLRGPLPRFVSVAQNFPTETVDDVDAAVAAEFARISPGDLTGKSVAVGVGSRGIGPQPAVLKAVIRELLAAGAKPFIIPAMGSHGGGNAKGQEAVLTSYGITEATMGVPIRSSMDVVKVDELDDGTPVYCDKLAYEADFIVPCNRVKPHTSFRGTHESGLMKMLAIGLSKHEGATVLHFHGFKHFHHLIPEAGKRFLTKTKVLFGIAMVENAREELRHVELVPAQDFVERDAALLEMAKASIPQLLFKSIDLLVIDKIGKDISGAGMDPNVTGKPGSRMEGFSMGPPINRIVIRDLTDATEGNATGIGMADVTTQRVVAKLDWTKTYLNIVTAGALDGARLPIVADTDQDAIGIGIRGCPGIASDQARIVRVRNTLEMTTVWASEPMLAEIEANPRLERLSDPFACEFDADGALLGTIELEH